MIRRFKTDIIYSNSTGDRMLILKHVTGILNIILKMNGVDSKVGFNVKGSRYEGYYIQERSIRSFLSDQPEESISLNHFNENYTFPIQTQYIYRDEEFLINLEKVQKLIHDIIVFYRINIHINIGIYNDICEISMGDNMKEVLLRCKHGILII